MDTGCFVGVVAIVVLCFVLINKRLESIEEMIVDLEDRINEEQEGESDASEES